VAFAVRLLAGREHCARELRDRLRRRGYPDDCIERVLTRLKENGYLSDLRFAEAFFRARMARGETPWLISRRAAQRGVEEAAIATVRENALSEFDPQAACRRLLAARDPDGLRFNDERRWQRLARYLRSKGYDAQTILCCLNERSGAGA